MIYLRICKKWTIIFKKVPKFIKNNIKTILLTNNWLIYYWLTRKLTISTLNQLTEKFLIFWDVLNLR